MAWSDACIMPSNCFSSGSASATAPALCPCHLGDGRGFWLQHQAWVAKPLSDGRGFWLQHQAWVAKPRRLLLVYVLRLSDVSGKRQAPPAASAFGRTLNHDATHSAPFYSPNSPHRVRGRLLPPPLLFSFVASACSRLTQHLRARARTRPGSTRAQGRGKLPAAGRGPAGSARGSPAPPRTGNPAAARARSRGRRTGSRKPTRAPSAPPPCHPPPAPRISHTSHAPLNAGGRRTPQGALFRYTNEI